MTGRLLPPRIPVVDPRNGILAREWYLYFLALATDGKAGFDADQFAIEPMDASLSARVAELERQLDGLKVGSVVL